MPGKNIHVIRNEGDRSWQLPFSRAELEKLLSAMAAEAELPPDAELELVLLSDAAMEELNNTHMGCHGPTNVLAFPSCPGPSALSGMPPASRNAGGNVSLGSMALSPDTLLRECLLYGQEVEEHCLRLLSHGMAHLLGHDHGPEMDALAARMFAAARQLVPQ